MSPSPSQIFGVIFLIVATLLAQFNSVSRLLSQTLRWSATTTTMSLVDHSFSPERCAELYNILLYKATVNDPTAVVERNLVPRFLEVAPELAEIPSFETSPLYAFFSRLETTPSPYSDSRFVPLTPEMHQPDPPFFYNELFTSEPSAILLFAQNNYDSPMDGGLFLNLQTYKAIWHWSPGRFPASEKWVSLETVLQSQLDKWKSGKFYWDTSTRSLAIKRWTQSDVTDALVAWDHLTSTIERKMPEGAREAHSRLEPLSVESMSSFRLSEFARAFLSRAPRPKFRHIAPGISTFSPETFLETYSSEPSDSFRRTFNLADSDTEEDWSSLLFPAGNTVPRDVSRNSDFDIKSFDEQWGFGKFTVNRHAGLYTDPDSTHSDGVRLLANSGLPAAFQFHDRCPWGPSHAPRLSQVILYWTSLVENGTWSVDADGVANGNGWVDSNLRQTKLNYVSI
ncbi:hypothetical protein V494_01746 [Pseudogymnoascus sp. VKM F-4513 (FW-928)]|nr:hypothetical protein V494_01746 [Pseudogymnoascus sp. VKM F-4513 (FW-928)]